MENWLERIDEEYKQFRTNMLDMMKESIYLNYEAIMLYETVHSYLMATKDDVYKNLSLMEIYQYYVGDDECIKVNLTTNEGIIQLLEYVQREHDKNDFYEHYEKEFEDFKNTFKAAYPETIFNDYERIRFYNIVYNYIQNQEYYIVKKRMKDRTIKELWIKYNNLKKDVSINNTIILERFLDNTK